jgi:RND family efflux transporter MFP subunit
MSRRVLWSALGILTLIALIVSAVRTSPLGAGAPQSNPPGTKAGNVPSVLVKTVTPRLGKVPNRVTGYGSAAAKPDGTVTVSLQHEAQIQRLAVRAGEPVRTGQLLMTVAASPTAIATYTQAVTALRVARTQLAHTLQLRAQQLATEDQVAQARKAVADAQAALDALQRSGGGKPTQSITSPFDAIVMSVQASSGDRVQANTPLLTLGRADSLVVAIGLEPAARRQVRPGQQARLEPLTAGGVPLEGSVDEVSGLVDPKTRLVEVVVRARQGEMLVGEGYRVSIVVGELAGWVLPRSAVLSDSSGPYVFQVVAGKAVRVGVTVVGSEGRTMVVSGPIDPQKPVVTQGNYQLSNGMAVRESQAA